MDRLLNLSPFLLKENKSHKYSNDKLFSRRETENSIIKPKNVSNLNYSIQRPFSSSTRGDTVGNNIHKKGKNKLLNAFYPNLPKKNKSLIFSNNDSKSNIKNKIHVVDYFYSNNLSKNNIESMINLEKYYSPNGRICKKKKSKHNKNILFNEIKFIDKLYLTDTNIIKPQIKNEDDLVNFNNFSEYCDEQIFLDYSKHQNADILKQFMNEKSNYNYKEIIKNEYNDKIIIKKRNKINIIKERINDFLERAKKQKNDKFTLNTKNELYNRMKEIYQNKLEYLDDKINSFENWKKLDHDFFDSKIEDYLKFLRHKKDFEKKKCEQYIEEKMEMKVELNKLISKMNKIEQEKNNILRWVYFQIKLNEKKTILPIYYRNILENINSIEKYYQNKLKKEKSGEIIQYSYTYSTSNKNINAISPKKKYKLKKYNKLENELNSVKKKNLKLNNELITFLNKEEGKKEYLRIKEYKNNLIFKTAEEFHERLLLIEQEDLRLIENNNYSQEKLYQLKKELEKVMQENKESNTIYKNNLEKRQNEIQELKNYKISLEEMIKILKDGNKYKKESKTKKRSNIINKGDDIIIKRRNNSEYTIIKKPITNYKKLLITKIAKLFDICKQIKIKNQKIYNILEEKKKLLKDNQILFYFIYIEFSINYLLGYFETYKKTHKDGNKNIKNIIVEIEKVHRIEKSEELKRQLIDKDIKLEYKINQRNNKIYFLPYKKCYDAPRSKKKEKVVKDDGKNHPKLEDFLYDENDSYHIIEKKY